MDHCKRATGFLAVQSVGQDGDRVLVSSLPTNNRRLRSSNKFVTCCWVVALHLGGGSESRGHSNVPSFDPDAARIATDRVGSARSTRAIAKVGNRHSHNFIAHLRRMAIVIKILLGAHASRAQHRCRVLIICVFVAYKRMDEARLLELSHSVLPMLGRGGRGAGTTAATTLQHFLTEVLEPTANLQLSHIVLLLEFREPLSLLTSVVFLGLARAWTRLGWTSLISFKWLRWEMLIDNHFFLDEAVVCTLFEEIMPGLLLERAQHIEISGLLRFI